MSRDLVKLHAVHELKYLSTLLPAAICFSGKLAAAVPGSLLDGTASSAAGSNKKPTFKECQTPTAYTLSGELNGTRIDPAGVLYQVLDVGVVSSAKDLQQYIGWQLCLVCRS